MSQTDLEARNVAAFTDIITRIINDGEVALCDVLMDPQMVIHRFGLASTGALLGPGGGAFAPPADAVEGFKRGLAMLRGAFPDWSHTLHQVVAKDDWVCGHWRLACTHQGTFMGLAPTGRAIDMVESGMIRFRDGRMIEGWFLGDELSLVRQLGAHVTFGAA
jgi:predicted ester cyclase